MISQQVLLFSLFVLARAETSIPDWTKYPIFFVGVAIIASVAWTLAFCCCLPFGCKMRVLILLIAAGGIGFYAYFLFGPWWTDIVKKDPTTITPNAKRANFLSP